MLLGLPDQSLINVTSLQQCLIHAVIMWMDNLLAFKKSLFHQEPFKVLNCELSKSLIENAFKEVQSLSHRFVPYSYGDLRDWDAFVFDESSRSEAPKLTELFETLPFESLLNCRIYRLKPMGWCGWHTEAWERAIKNDLIPLTVNIPLNEVAGAYLAFFCGQRLAPRLGQVFSINFSKAHGAFNQGREERFHAKVTGLISKEKCLSLFFGNQSALTGFLPWDERWPRGLISLKGDQTRYDFFWGFNQGLTCERILGMAKLKEGVRPQLVHQSSLQLEFKSKVYKRLQHEMKIDYHQEIEKFLKKYNALESQKSHGKQMTHDIWNGEGNLNELLTLNKDIYATANMVVANDPHAAINGLTNLLMELTENSVPLIYLDDLLEQVPAELTRAFLKEILRLRNYKLITSSFAL